MNSIKYTHRSAFGEFVQAIYDLVCAGVPEGAPLRAKAGPGAYERLLDEAVHQGSERPAVGEPFEIFGVRVELVPPSRRGSRQDIEYGILQAQLSGEWDEVTIEVIDDGEVL